MALTNVLLLLCQAFLYFGVMAVLFRARHRFGIGIFICALGAMHFLETYLAAVFYIQLPFGIISPGSTVLFSGKLIMLLLLYIREDAATVRQPIYGLLVGNLLVVGLVLILRQHEIAASGAGRMPDLSFVDEMGWLQVWGTTLLFIDGIAIILLYEHLGRRIPRQVFVRVFLSSAAILTFDQIAFYLALHHISGASTSTLVGGWVAKMGAALVYSTMVSAYLRWVESRPVAGRIRLSDIFDTLTYRERYEALLARSGRDSLTGLLDRGRFALLGQQMTSNARLTHRPVSLLVIDVDHFKTINDQHGHTVGDQVLIALGGELRGAVRHTDCVFRYGGEEFVVLGDGLPHDRAMEQAERIRHLIQALDIVSTGQEITVSIGVATAPQEGDGIDQLFKRADDRLYMAKRAGRNRVVGSDDASPRDTEDQRRPGPARNSLATASLP